MIPFDLVKQLPAFLVKGYKDCRAQQKEAQK
jgi:hypothetical protein